MASAPARSLAQQLRRWSEEQLGTLLRARPDLAVPAPADSAQLAARASTRTSVLRALDELGTLDLAVLEAVVNGSVADLNVEDPRSVSGALELLEERLLVWSDGDRVAPLTAVVDLFALPAGPPADQVAGLLEGLDDRARAILDHLDRTGREGTVDAVPTRPSVAGARTPTELLLAHRLLVARDARHVTLPWTVRVALRGHATREPVDRAPALATAAKDPALVDRMAAGAAFEACRKVELLLDRWGTQPPAALRDGGLGVRDLKATGELLDVAEAEAALVVETAYAAGLVAVGSTDELDAAWLPTDAFDGWLAETPATRWTRLVRAWWDAPRLTGLVGGRVDPRERPHVLEQGLERPWLPRVRRRVLQALAEVEPGTVLSGAEGEQSLLDLLAWRRPRRPREHDAAVRVLLAEAAQLGVTGRGGLSGAGRLLVRGEDPTATLAGLLPEPVDHVLLQADLTAVAPGPLDSELATRLALLADVDSRGGATVYRFAGPTVRRAFDAGWSAAEVHDFLSSVSRTPVPQALDYLVDDVARRFGVLRMGTAESFLRSEDESALTELLHRPDAASLRLRRLAPTVAVSDVPLGTLLPRIRALGVAPVVEAADGTVRVARADVHRARAGRRRAGAPEDVREPARLAAVISAVRAGDRVADRRPTRAAASTPADVVALLRTAVEEDREVLIGYVGHDGTVAERLVTPYRVEAGRLTGYDARTDTECELRLHRITAASLAQR